MVAFASTLSFCRCDRLLSFTEFRQRRLRLTDASLVEAILDDRITKDIGLLCEFVVFMPHQVVSLFVDQCPLH